VKIDNFFSELKRRNVYKVAIAYGVVAWLLMQIASQIFPFFDIPIWAVRLVVLLLIIGFPIALILAWAFELTPEGIKRTEDTDATRRPSRGRAWIYILVIGAGLSVGLFFLGRYTATSKQSGSAELPAKSIAVLPFVDLSAEHDQEYFCDGISEEILDALAKVEGLRVVARTSSFSFKGKDGGVSEIGQKLNVQNVLEGSLRREGNRIRVTAQLVNARDGFHIWSDTYERELQGVFAVQDEITHSIVDALKIKLAVAPSPHPHQNTEAYDLYLQGLYLSNKSDEQSLRKSLDLFQRALDKDPNLARAWTGIAKDWGWLADAYVKPMEAWPKVKEAALKALALDERDAEAHIRLGGAKGILDWDPAGEKAELKRALELDPNSASARESLGWLLACEGDTNQGVFLLSEAKKLDPLSPAISYMLTWAYLAADRFDDAIAEGQRTLQLDPSYSYLGPPIAIAYREKGEFEKAITLYAKRQQATHSPSAGLAVTYARMGRQVEARRILDQLLQEAQTRYIPADSIAGVYAELGEKDGAFRWLERAYTEHSSVLRFIGISHTFRSLHSDPRFADLLRRMGFDPMKVLRQQNNP
jgi:adenylate cyclase